MVFIEMANRVQSVRRESGFVSIEFADRIEAFDRVVIATTPECALRLLADPTPAERRWLGLWQDSSTTTIAHFSETFYQQRQIALRTPGDCFEKEANGVVGYNCCLNDLYGISSDRQYSFGANLDDWITPEEILDVQQHVTPLYNVDATEHRHEIRHLKGQNNTYYAGAYLFDGLHEGAITSAVEVSARLGGRTI